MKEKEYTLQLTTSDTPSVFTALSCYTKGGLVCFAMVEDGKKVVKKYPLCNVHSIKHEY